MGIESPVSLFLLPLGLHSSTSGASLSLNQLSSSPRAPLACKGERHPPNRQPIIVTARAVCAMETGSLEFSRRFVVGAEFQYISENDIRFLDDIIANRIQTTS